MPLIKNLTKLVVERFRLKIAISLVIKRVSWRKFNELTTTINTASFKNIFINMIFVKFIKITLSMVGSIVKVKIIGYIRGKKLVYQIKYFS